MTELHYVHTSANTLCTETANEVDTLCTDPGTYWPSQYVPGSLSIPYKGETGDWNGTEKRNARSTVEG